MSVRIPLFRLGVVLFPHMPLALHIFESRYRAMMRDCQEQGISFGVVAIREGLDVGDESLPYEVGTLAQFQEVEELEDGRYKLVVTGASRFRVEDVLSGRPYLVGSVRYLEDIPGEAGDLVALTTAVSRAFKRYSGILRELGGDPPGEAEVPDDPELLSYLVAASLQVEVPIKQSLLEIDSASVRLHRCRKLLSRETAILGAMLARRDQPSLTFSPN